jgi:hypothetical protein
MQEVKDKNGIIMDEQIERMRNVERCYKQQFYLKVIS